MWCCATAHAACLELNQVFSNLNSIKSLHNVFVIRSESKKCSFKLLIFL